MGTLLESNFKRLIGIWRTTGSVISGERTLQLSGTDSYEWILDGNYLLHKAHVKMGHERNETLEVIRPDHSGPKANMQYFNSKGEEGVMTGSIINNEFNIESETLKFSGTINSQNTLITGKWYRQTEDKKWVELIELRLEKTDRE